MSNLGSGQRLTRILQRIRDKFLMWRELEKHINSKHQSYIDQVIEKVRRKVLTSIG